MPTSARDARSGQLESLRDAVRQFEVLLGHSAVGAALLGADCRILKPNAALCRFLGCEEPELLGRSLTDFTHPDDRSPGLEHAREVLEGLAESSETESRYIRKDGTLLWARVSVGLVRGADGRSLYLLPIVQDITERKQAEAALQESEERYRTAFVTSPDAVNVNRLSDGLFLDVNDGFFRLTGWKPEDVHGKTSVEVAVWADLADRERLISALQLNGSCENLQARFRLKDGTTRPGLMSAKLITYKGERCILSVTRDISDITRAEEERRQFERQFQQAQKLESLGVLAGGIAHDFNNILMAVLGHAELALEELPATEPARRSLAEISAAARRAAELCRQMLAYSGRASFAMEPVNLSELVGQMLHLLRASVSKKAMLETDLDKEIPNIQADPSQLRQVVMNLVVNASEALGEQNGVIRIAVAAVRCDKDYLKTTEVAGDLKDGLYVRLEVQDDGCGMSGEVRQRIFEPFFSTKFSGRGLGLAALLGIVRSQRGGVKVESEPGKGSRFTLLFPAMAPASLGTGESHEASHPWRALGTVLLADDDEMVRGLGEKMLSRLGFEVITAADGVEAVEAFRAHRADIRLAILDLTMPNLDGAEAFQELRRIDPTLPIVVASGYGSEDVAARLPDTAVPVLQKPYSLGRMQALLAGLKLDDPNVR